MTWTLLALLAACDRAPCDVDAAIEPGCGLQLDGTDVHVGDALSRLSRKLGDPDTVRDHGALGTLHTWPGGVSAWVDADELVTSLRITDGFTGQTSHGLGAGSTQDAVRSALGEPTVDPMLGSWWYPTDGIGFEWVDGAVSRVVIGSP